jgi:hypothetical protein
MAAAMLHVDLYPWTLISSVTAALLVLDEMLCWCSVLDE